MEDVVLSIKKYFMKDIIYVDSISQVHEFLGLEHPKHPLISVFPFGRNQQEMADEDFRYSFGLYQVSLKGNCPLMISKYGRNSYDFQECSMIFTAPNQVLEFNTDYKTNDEDCWTLIFHPDLIRKSELGRKIDNYSFFSYASNEALHLSFDERKVITDIIDKIIKEYSGNIDAHSQTLILSNLELLLNYAVRYYDRQFYTRTTFNQDIVSEFEELLKTFYQKEMQLDIGVPSVQYCAEQMKISPKYLSDLLRKETGSGAQEHIHHFVIDKAKSRLLNSNESASEIAFALGFEYSQYFSRIFKKKTTMTPNEYRKRMN